MFKKVILIVDDDLSVRRALRRLIASMRFQTILEAGEGNEALGIMRARFRTRPVNLVICDWQMGPPGMNGDILTLNIRQDQNFAHIPVIMVTGASPTVMVMARTVSGEAGVTELLFKPVEDHVLFETIRRVLQPRSE